ncbi:hypothetical protein FF1_028245 [Malus domestica]|uniref:Uncharacterized protein n=1 Tax=Malus domestica TaxID=3750 RepID=A0A498KA06_MALDO|nr:hypothetical protein DVH24_006366 [Malus domestica]
MLSKKFQSSTSRCHAHGDCGEVGTVSKGCLKFYLSVPSVNFDAVVKTNQKRVELMSSLDRYLIHRGHNKMQRFSICWKSFSSQTLIKHSDERFRIITWINGAVRCNVEELHLDFSAKGTVTFAHFAF